MQAHHVPALVLHLYAIVRLLKCDLLAVNQEILRRGNSKRLFPF